MALTRLTTGLSEQITSFAVKFFLCHLQRNAEDISADLLQLNPLHLRTLCLNQRRRRSQYLPKLKVLEQIKSWLTFENSESPIVLLFRVTAQRLEDSGFAACQTFGHGQLTSPMPLDRISISQGNQACIAVLRSSQS